MLRISTLTFAVLAISAVPLAAFAETAGDGTTTEAVLLAVVEDALPVAPPRIASPQVETKLDDKSNRIAPHGSSQSSGAFRFSNPYAFPQQTLPVSLSPLPTFGF